MTDDISNTAAWTRTFSVPSEDALTLQHTFEDLSTKEEDYLKTSMGTLSAEDDFPDGGLRAWLVVLGAACATLATFGFVNAWGVFQAYYQQTLLSNVSPSKIAWIGSVQYALTLLPGLIVGRLFDIGIFTTPFLISSVLVVVATILTAECTQYWHFLLCQGIGIGLFSGVVFNPTMGIIGHWFKKRRAFALGLSALGSAIGGTVIPIVTRNLIAAVGFKWTMRCLGLVLFFILGIANVTLRRRLPPVNNHKSFVNLNDFKNPVYSIYCLGGFVTFLGIYTVQTYIDISAIFVGIDEGFAFYLLAISNVGSGAGRLFSGYTADKIGPLSVVIPFTVVAGVLTYVWPFVTTKGGLIALALVYGFSSGSFVSLAPAPLMSMGGPHDVGRRVGMAFTVFALGALVGPPISGAINSATVGYKDVGYYAGSCVMVGASLMMISRHLMLGKLWGKF